MEQPDNRLESMQRDVLLIATAALSLVNGMHFSPWFDPVAVLLRPFVAGTFLSSPIVFLYLTSIFISLMTLLIAGVPAALYERFQGLKQSSTTSLMIWLGATGLLAADALLAAAGAPR